MRENTLYEVLQTARKHRRTQKGNDAINQLITMLTPLINTIASAHYAQLENQTLEDLMQEAYLVVIESVDSYPATSCNDDDYEQYIIGKLNDRFNSMKTKEEILPPSSMRLMQDVSAKANKNSVRNAYDSDMVLEDIYLRRYVSDPLYHILSLLFLFDSMD